MNMTALKPMQNQQPQPACPDSATFWHDKRVIVTGGSGFLGFLSGDTDLPETTACLPAFAGHSMRNATL